MKPRRHRYRDGRLSLDYPKGLLIHEDCDLDPTIDEAGSDEGQRGRSGRR